MQVPTCSRPPALSGHSQPAEGLAGIHCPTAINGRAYQQLNGAWSSQQMADVASREPLHDPHRHGEL